MLRTSVQFMKLGVKIRSGLRSDSAGHWRKSTFYGGSTGLMLASSLVLVAIQPQFSKCSLRPTLHNNAQIRRLMGRWSGGQVTYIVMHLDREQESVIPNMQSVIAYSQGFNNRICNASAIKLRNQIPYISILCSVFSQVVTFMSNHPLKASGRALSSRRKIPYFIQMDIYPNTVCYALRTLLTAIRL